MKYLLDTNIVSEVRKGPRCDAGVAAWWRQVDDSNVYLSVLVVGEIRKGIELIRRRSADRAAALEEWLIELNAAHGHRIVEIDHRVAEQWGRMSAIRNVPTVDCLLAATAKVHRMTLVTRNEADVASLGIDVLNPFARKR